MKVLLRCAWMAVAVMLLTAAVAFAADRPFAYEGFRVCAKCHDRQGESWRHTVHAKALDSLKPNAKAEAKLKAKLDPAKDYSQDANCLGCHVTGFNRPNGYAVGMDPAAARLVSGVGCEACHGAGSVYRNEHGEADNRLKRSGEYTERRKLTEAGQSFDYEATCARCHLNYEGSGAKDVKAPFNPFTPAVDPKYAFDFSKAVMGKAIHEHFKLIGVFKGEPVPKFRAELQKTAKDPDE